jgi:hypothetical protein
MVAGDTVGQDVHVCLCRDAVTASCSCTSDSKILDKSQLEVGKLLSSSNVGGWTKVVTSHHSLDEG